MISASPSSRTKSKGVGRAGEPVCLHDRAVNARVIRRTILKADTLNARAPENAPAPALARAYRLIAKRRSEMSVSMSLVPVAASPENQV